MNANTCDVLIIGGGLAGTALAYCTASAGASVILLEAGFIGSGTSGACAGRAQLIESETEAYLDLTLTGFAKLAGLGAELGIDLEWELPGHLTLLFDAAQWQQYEGLTRRLNRRGAAAAMLDQAALREAEPILAAGRCLGAAFSTEGHVNPFKLLAGYANAARRHGAVLHTRKPVTAFERQADRITVVRAGETLFSAGTVVLAAGAWTGKLAENAGSSLPMRFTHAEAMVSEPLPPFIHHHIGMSGFYEAVHGQARTVTLGLGQHPNGTLVISNAIEQAAQIDMESRAWSMPAMARALTDFFPGLKNIRIVRSWAAPSPYLPDFQPAIGWLPGVDNLFVAAGFHLAVSTIPWLADMMTESVLRGQAPCQNPVLKPFSPERFSR